VTTAAAPFPPPLNQSVCASDAEMSYTPATQDEGGGECSGDSKRKAHFGRGVNVDNKRQDRSTMSSAVALLDRNSLESVKEVLNLVVQHPFLIHDPDLKFVKSFLLHFGCEDLPGESLGKEDSSSSADRGATPSMSEEQYSSYTHRYPGEVECEEDDYLEEGIDDKLIPPENAPLPPLGGTSTDGIPPADYEKADQYHDMALEAFRSKNYSLAVKHYTCSLQLVATPLAYARRGESLLADYRPMAALRDCDLAIQMNPNSAKALKTRGKVQRALGEWERACADLSLGLSIDYDKESDDLLKECNEFMQRVLARRRAREQREAERLRETGEHRRVELTRSLPPTPQPLFLSIVLSCFLLSCILLSNWVCAFVACSTLSPEVAQEIWNDSEMIAAMTNPKVREAMKMVERDPTLAVQFMADPDIWHVVKRLVEAMMGKPASDVMEGTEDNLREATEA